MSSSEQPRPWTIDDVERLAAVMKAGGLTMVEVHGLRLVRNTAKDAADAIAERLGELNIGGKGLSDDALLENPYAGLGLDEEVNHGA